MLDGPDVLDIPRTHTDLTALGQNVDAASPIQDRLLQWVLPESAHPNSEDAANQGEISIHNLRDEFDNASTVNMIDPLKSVEIEVPKYDGSADTEIENFDIQIDDEFTYLSRTRNIEIHSPRIDQLQKIVTAMTQGTGVDARVVIMNRGQTGDAFVYPDGTIFVSQAILNQLDSLDEIGAVLAHEINHLILRTFERSSKAGGKIESLGVSWLHEAASDALVPDLMVKANLNTLSLSTAIEKISGNSRGPAHQSGIARGTQSLGQHRLINYPTSKNPLQPIPADLQRPAEPTNLEVIAHYIDSDDFDNDKFAEAVEQLHPYDIRNVYPIIFDHFKRKRLAQGEAAKEGLLSSEQNRLYRACQDIIHKRLIGYGYSEQDFAYFMGTNKELHVHGLQPRLEPEAALQLSHDLPSLIESRQYQKMFQSLFKRVPPERNINYASTIGEYLAGVHCDQDKYFNFGPFANQDTIIGYIRNLQAAFPEQPQRGNYVTQPVAQKAISSYLVSFLHASRSTNELEVIRDFVTALKDSGATFNVLPEFFTRSHTAIKDNLPQLWEKAFSPQESASTVQEDIDIFFSEFDLADKACADNLGTFVEDLHKRFETSAITPEQRRDYLDYIAQKIDTTDLQLARDMYYTPNYDYIRRHTSNPPDDNDEFRDINARLVRCNLKSVFGFTLFDEDSDDFYEYMRKVSDGIDLQDIPTDILRHVWNGMSVATPSLYSSKKASYYIPRNDRWGPTSAFAEIEPIVTIGRYEEFCDLPINRELIQRYNDISDIENFNQLLEHIDYNLGLSNSWDNNSRNISLFSDHPIMLAITEGARQRLFELLNEEIPNAALPDVYHIIDRSYPSGPERKGFLMAIRQRIFDSLDTSLEEKTQFLLNHIYEIGYPGFVRIAQQIETIEEFRMFYGMVKEKLQSQLAGSPEMTAVAVGDFLTAMLTDKFDRLFATCSNKPAEQASSSTDAAMLWSRSVFGISVQMDNPGVKYQPQNNTFSPEYGIPGIFSSLPDAFNRLHMLNSTQRIAIALKALTDSEGAFSSPEHRRQLGELIAGSLTSEMPFISDVIRTACETGDAKLLSLAIAQMAAPLMFRSLDIEAVDVDQVHRETSIERSYGTGHIPKKLDTRVSRADLEVILKAPTVDIVAPPVDLEQRPDPHFVELSKAKTRQYREIKARLKRALGIEDDTSETAENQHNIPAEAEAIIRGCETSAIGKKSLQLTAQMMSFDEPIELRLQDSFDRNPGLEKLWFWVNLDRLSREDPEIGNFVRERLIRVGEYLGGGSLYTTFSAVMRGDDGNEERVVLKMLNPNAGANIAQEYKLATDVLSEVAEHGGPESARYARVGLESVDLANQWCVREMDDPTYEADDALYASTVSAYNEQAGREAFYAPEDRLNTFALKVQQEAEIQTVKAFLQDDTVDHTAKRDAVEDLGRLFAFEVNQKIDADGQQLYLVRSDPHIGNSIIEKTDAGSRIAILDRHLYLRFNEQQITAFRALAQGDNLGFLNNFVDSLLDANHVSGRLERMRVGTGMKARFIAKYLQQQSADTISQMALVQELSDECLNRGLTIPLEFRLMLKNVISMKRLLNRYGIDLAGLMGK